MFCHSITEFVFLMNILGKRSNLSFSRKSDCKKEKSTVSFTHEQNIICSQTLLDSIAHEQTIICSQLFAGHMVGSQSMKRQKNLLRMIIIIIILCFIGLNADSVLTSIIEVKSWFHCIIIKHYLHSGL